MEACISDRPQDLKLTTLKDAKSAAFVLCSYSVMMLQFLYTPQKKKEEEENNKNKQRIKTQNAKSSLNNLHTLNLQNVIPKYSTSNYKIPAGHFKCILCTPCCWLESARQWSRKALVSTVQWCALHPSNCAAGQRSGLGKSLNSAVPTLLWCALHPSNCAVGQWSGLGKSLNSIVPTLWWCALHPTNCAAGQRSGLGKSLKGYCASSSVVCITPNKLNSWTMTRFGKKPTKNCANSPVVCTTPNKLCTGQGSGLEQSLKSTVPNLQWYAHHLTDCSAG